MQRLFTAFATLTIAASAFAQGEPDGRLLRAGTDSLAVFLVRGSDTTRTGVIVDEVSVINIDGRALIRRVYRTRDRVLGNRLDTLVDEQTTLRPVRHRSRSSRAHEFLSFAGGRVSGYIRLVNGDSVGVETSVAPTTYNGSSVDLVIRASPLSDSWQTDMVMFLSNSRSAAPFRARVKGSDTIDGVSAWRVEAEFTGMPVTFWIAKDSRKLVRQAMYVRPDMTILFAKPMPGQSGKRATQRGVVLTAHFELVQLIR